MSKGALSSGKCGNHRELQAIFQVPIKLIVIDGKLRDIIDDLFCHFLSSHFQNLADQFCRLSRKLLAKCLFVASPILLDLINIHPVHIDKIAA